MNAPHVAFGISQELREAHVATMAAGGLRLARSDLLWNVADDTKPADGVYDWGAGSPDDYDVWVETLATAGIRWAPLLNGSTSWARAPGCKPSTCTPLVPWFDEFARFAAAAVQRYGVDGDFWAEHPDLPYLPATSWEIWNEPNLTWSNRCNIHQPGLDLAPREYAIFFSKAEAAIHAVDPDAHVIVGGLADLGPSGNQCGAAEFARGMHAQDPGLFGRVDGVGLHEYQQTPAGVRGALSAFRRLLDFELGGSSALLHLNEVGWGTTPGTLLVVSDETRGAYLSEVADTLLRSRCGVRSVLPYAWRTPERDPVLDTFDWFGIANQDGTAKASGVAYMNMVATLQGEGAVAPDPSTFEGGPDEPALCDWRAASEAPPPVVPEVPVPTALVLTAVVLSPPLLKRCGPLRRG